VNKERKTGQLLLAKRLLLITSVEGGGGGGGLCVEVKGRKMSIFQGKRKERSLEPFMRREIGKRVPLIFNLPRNRRRRVTSDWGGEGKAVHNKAQKEGRVCHDEGKHDLSHTPTEDKAFSMKDKGGGEGEAGPPFWRKEKLPPPREGKGGG